MNKKPWDELRRPVTPPMESGEFRIGGGIRVSLTVDKKFARVSLGRHENTPITFGKESAREFADFFTDLADQLEGK